MGEDNHQYIAEQRWWADGWMYTQSRSIDKEMLVKKGKCVQTET